MSEAEIARANVRAAWSNPLHEPIGYVLEFTESGMLGRRR